MVKIGLTGGIGSGKTTVAGLWAEKGYPVYIADLAASELINHNKIIKKAFIRLFGTSIYQPDGTLNKQALAHIIFNNPETLQKVNTIVHPEVMKDFNRWSLKQDKPAVLFESAILFEAHLEKNFDYIICVYASPETRIKRVMQRDHTTAEKVLERIKNQMDDDVKCQKSNFIIHTDNHQSLSQQITEIEKQLKLE